VGAELSLSCHVGANPLGQHSIVQIEWLVNGRKVAPSALTSVSGHSSSAAARQQQSAEGAQYSSTHTLSTQHAHTMQHSLQHNTQHSVQLHVDAANHLHMPSALPPALSDPLELGRSLRLHATSRLSLGPVQRAHAANYSCQYKLIPTPAAAPPGLSPSGSTGAHSQPAARVGITSGQANQTVQVTVIEGQYAHCEHCVLLL